MVECEALDEPPSGLVCIATITSRNEAQVIATALQHQGIPVWIDGEQYASVYPVSVALGGHRLTVPASEWNCASALLREIGLPGSDVSYAGQRYAVARLLAVYLGSHLFLGIPAIIAGFLPAAWLAGIPLMALGVPVDPRGRGDYYLSDSSSK